MYVTRFKDNIRNVGLVYVKQYFSLTIKQICELLSLHLYILILVSISHYWQERIISGT